MSQSGKYVRDYVNWQIFRLRDSNDESGTRAGLAILRRGLGKQPGSDPNLWPYTLEALPVILLSQTGYPTNGEWAIHTAMTLFALHQQGLSLKETCMNVNKTSFAEAIANLVKTEEDLKRVKRRFDAAVTAEGMTELAHHARSLVQLLRSQKIPFDYPRFAEDLFWYQFPTLRDRVRLRWGQDFYQSYGRKRSSKITTDKPQAED